MASKKITPRSPARRAASAGRARPRGAAEPRAHPGGARRGARPVGRVREPHRARRAEPAVHDGRSRSRARSGSRPRASWPRSNALGYSEIHRPAARPQRPARRRSGSPQPGQRFTSRGRFTFAARPSPGGARPARAVRRDPRATRRARRARRAWGAWVGTRPERATRDRGQLSARSRRARRAPVLSRSARRVITSPRMATARGGARRPRRAGRARGAGRARIRRPDRSRRCSRRRTPSHREVPRARQIFVNRNLRMDKIELVGFDMDYTLAMYHLQRLEDARVRDDARADDRRARLSRDLGALQLRPRTFVIRGLVDGQAARQHLQDGPAQPRGPLLPRRRPLPHEERRLYRDEKVHLSSPRFAWIDTLFALPEACLFARGHRAARGPGRDARLHEALRRHPRVDRHGPPRRHAQGGGEEGPRALPPARIPSSGRRSTSSAPAGRSSSCSRTRSGTTPTR